MHYIFKCIPYCFVAYLLYGIIAIAESEIKQNIENNFCKTSVDLDVNKTKKIENVANYVFAIAGVTGVQNSS